MCLTCPRCPKCLVCPMCAVARNFRKVAWKKISFAWFLHELCLVDWWTRNCSMCLTCPRCPGCLLCPMCPVSYGKWMWKVRKTKLVCLNFALLVDELESVESVWHVQGVRDVLDFWDVWYDQCVFCVLWLVTLES